MPAQRSFALRSAVVAASLGLTIVFAGCTAGEPSEPTDSPSPSPSRSSATPTPTTAAPVFDPEGTAEENRPVFALVVSDVWASQDRALGRAYIDALVAVGFDKAAMQVTQDMTTVGNPAESIEFSVLWQSECLVGQVGPAIPKPVVAVMPALPGDLCLIGATRPIDW